MTLHHFALVGVSLMALAILAAWMFVVSKRHFVTRILGCIVALGLAIGVWSNVTAMLGYAVADHLPIGRLQLVGMVDDVGNGKIYLWVKTPDGPRAFVVPYEQGLAGDLIAGLKRAHADGSRVMVDIGGGDQKSGIKDKNTHGQKFHVILVPGIPPKE
jgi:hypothetical protein